MPTACLQICFGKKYEALWMLKHAVFNYNLWNLCLIYVLHVGSKHTESSDSGCVTDNWQEGKYQYQFSTGPKRVCKGLL